MDQDQNQNGVTKIAPRPEAQTVTRLVALLLGIIAGNGELLARCADAISAFDADLAEEAFDEAYINMEVIKKAERRAK